MGVRADGTEELITMNDGYRESSDSCADLLRDCRRRGMRAPVLTTGDGDIESTFASVRLRTEVTKDAGSAAAALAMVFELVESAQEWWRAVNAPHLVPLVRTGARFEGGQLVERPQTTAA